MTGNMAEDGQLNKPIKDHIQRIKDTIALLEEDLKRHQDPMEKLKTETDLRSLRLAIMHYELALEIEREVIEGRSARGAESNRKQ